MVLNELAVIVHGTVGTAWGQDSLVFGVLPRLPVGTRWIDPVALQAEMDSLADQHSQLMATSIGERYGFNAAHPSPIAYVTATFLHAGWLHLIGNMWFLWVTGFCAGRRVGPTDLPNGVPGGRCNVTPVLCLGRSQIY
jgi:membrane associated rhomboid family serine protease